MNDYTRTLLVLGAIVGSLLLGFLGLLSSVIVHLDASYLSGNTLALITILLSSALFILAGATLCIYLVLTDLEQRYRRLKEIKHILEAYDNLQQHLETLKTQLESFPQDPQN